MAPFGPFLLFLFIVPTTCSPQTKHLVSSISATQSKQTSLYSPVIHPYIQKHNINKRYC